MTREEAIKRIKAWNLDSDDMEVLSAVIPELAESEDERIRRDIIHYILYKADGVSEEQEHSWIAYLEKQKEQKPAEWSEEDEKVWQDIFDLCNRFGYDDACRKLKSLRPRPHWKPSEEQLNYVNWAYSIAVAENDTKAIEVLGELHDTLLNLMQ